MKKLFSSLLSLAVVAVMTVLSSCGGTPDVSSIVEKYNNGDELTEADYSSLIDYANAAIDEALPIAKEFKEALEGGDMENLNLLQDELNEIKAKFVHADVAEQILDNATAAELGEANVERLADMKQNVREAME